MKAKISIECSAEAAKRIVLMLMEEPVTHLDVSYEDPEARSYFPKSKTPKKVTPKRPLLRDRVMAEFEDRRPVKQGAREIVLEALTTGQVRTIAVLSSLCMKAGYGKTAASVVLTTLVQKGEVERVDAGIYRLTRPQAIEHEPVLRLEAPPASDHTVSHADLVFELLADGEVHHRKSVIEKFEEHGASEQAADKILSHLAHRNEIERLGAGNYRRLNGAHHA